jgi:bacterioferritin
MGTVGKEIIGIDVNKLVEKLNKALADEWLAYYQYWIGAKVVNTNFMQVISELEEHAEEELKHAVMLVDRILQLDGIPLLDPKKWFEETNCGYNVPSDFEVAAIVKQNIEGEQCAIKTYKEILDMVRGNDDITYQMILEIFKDEIKHEDDLEKILESL